MHKRDIWNNLLKFLEKEFTLCENLTAYEKGEQCLNIKHGTNALPRGASTKHFTNIAQTWPQSTIKWSVTYAVKMTMPLVLVRMDLNPCSTFHAKRLSKNLLMTALNY